MFPRTVATSLRCRRKTLPPSILRSNTARLSDPMQAGQQILVFRLFSEDSSSGPPTTKDAAPKPPSGKDPVKEGGFDRDAAIKAISEFASSAGAKIRDAGQRFMPASASSSATMASQPGAKKAEASPAVSPQHGEVAKNGEEAVEGEEWYSKRVSFWMGRYEDFVGLTEVKAAQEKVVRAEREFSREQEKRREAQLQIREVQEKVKEIHAELEKTYRGEDKYLTLITQEHQILKDEQRLMQEFKEHEKREREKFSLLSAAVRDSHEKERAQAEKTKYWSVIGSVVGTCLGILGTTINNRLRMRELRELVSRSASGERLMDVSERLDKDLQSHEEKLSGLIVQVQGALSDSKLGLGRVTELQEASQKLEAVGVKLLSGGEDKKAASAAIASLVKKTDDLHRSVAAYQKNLQTLLLEVRRELNSQTQGVQSILAERQKHLDLLAKSGEDRDRMLKESFGALYKNQLTLGEVFGDRTQALESSVKEVLSLIKTAQTTAASRRDREQRALASMDASLVDKIEDALEDHEARIRSSSLAVALFVAAVTPLAVVAINKLF